MNEDDQRRLDNAIGELLRIERLMLRWEGGRGRRRNYQFVYPESERSLLDVRVVQVLRCAYELLDALGYSVYEYRPGDYDRYIDSPTWARRASEAKERAGFRCERCGQPGDRLDVHHQTYERLGAELPEDLEVLCGDCHAAEHGVES